MKRDEIRKFVDINLDGAYPFTEKEKEAVVDAIIEKSKTSTGDWLTGTAFDKIVEQNTGWSRSTEEGSYNFYAEPEKTVSEVG